MVAVRALQRRVTKLEQVGKPRLSPLTRWYGSFDNFVARGIMPGIRAGTLSEGDMHDIIEVMARWEKDGTWN